MYNQEEASEVVYASAFASPRLMPAEALMLTATDQLLESARVTALDRMLLRLMSVSSPCPLAIPVDSESAVAEASDTAPPTMTREPAEKLADTPTPVARTSE